MTTGLPELTNCCMLQIRWRKRSVESLGQIVRAEVARGSDDDPTASRWMSDSVLNSM